MVSYIKSKVQQSLSFLMVLIIVFSVFSGVLFLNPSPSYAYNKSDFSRAPNGESNLVLADLSVAIADSQTKFPYGFDAVGAGVRNPRLINFITQTLK